MADETVLASSAGWSVVRLDDGDLLLRSPWSGVAARLSRPADVALLFDAYGSPAVAGAAVACMLAGLVGGDYDD